jgi:hypothetical protein
MLAATRAAKLDIFRLPLPSPDYADVIKAMDGMPADYVAQLEENAGINGSSRSRGQASSFRQASPGSR